MIHVYESKPYFSQCRSVDDKNKKGIISNVANYGAGDILEVQWNDKKLESFPFTNDFVETVDFENNLVKVKSQKYI